MRPCDEIENVVKKMSFKAGPQMDKDLWAETSKARDELQKSMLAPGQHHIGRAIMRSPITKLAVAAAVILACVIGLSFWQTTGSGIALADVLARIEQVRAYRYQLRSTVTWQETSTESVTTVLISQEHGMKMLEKRIDTKSGAIEPWMDSYFLPRSNTILCVNHKYKEHATYKFEDDRARSSLEVYNDPALLIEQFMRCKHTRLGQSIVDGITVEGFHTTDLAYQGGVVGKADLGGEPKTVDAKIWVDVTTSLPVRSEETITMKSGRRVHEVSDHFQWHVAVTPDDFSPVIPDDYRNEGVLVLPKNNEETAIKALRLIAELAGTFPANLDNLDIPTILKLPAGGPDAWKKPLPALPEAEKRELADRIVLLHSLGAFYQALIDEEQAPAYYGERVGPGEADKVLLRWKVSDSEYRVIFGDLHAETVSLEKLVELEKAVPK